MSEPSVCSYNNDPEQKTVIRNIWTEIDHTGLITPVASFDPVEIDNKQFSQAPLYSMGYIESTLDGLAIGDTVLVYPCNTIPRTPKITSVVTRSGNTQFTVPYCPVCGSRVYRVTDSLYGKIQTYCSNPDCLAILEQRLLHWCSQDAMDIKPMDAGVIRVLIYHNLVERIYDIYGLTENQLSSYFSPDKSAALFQAIQASKNNNIDRLITGLNIPRVRPHISEPLAERYPSMYAIVTAAMTDDLTRKGIPKDKADNIKTFVLSREGQDLLRQLEACGVNLTSKSYKGMS